MTIVVRGIGDVGSAVAHALFGAGHRVWISDDPLPAAPRRGMSFADAAFEGRAELAGVEAVWVAEVESLGARLASRTAVPVFLGDLRTALQRWPADALVDARMRKHAVPEPQLGLARLTIGLGPGFEAGVTTDLVIETQWGDELGRVISEGRSRELTGEPRNYGGYSRERFVYAPAGGVFRTSRKIADRVEQDEVVARLGDMDLHAPLAGILRGLVHDGAVVKERDKVVEVDPRCDPSKVLGIGERPGRIAVGVLNALTR